jgi:hypothetical protein
MIRPRLAAAALIAAAPLVAAGAELLDRLTLRQTIDPKMVAKPALVHGVWSRTSADSWDIAAAVRYDLAFGWLAEYSELTPFVDYQRNTAIEKEQDQLKAGMAADANLGDLSTRNAIAALSAQLGYARDRVNRSDGLLGRVAVTIVARGCGLEPSCFWRPNVESDLVAFSFSYTPLLGMEYEQTFDAKDPATEGDALRVFARLQASVFPAARLFRHRIQLLADIAVRRDLGGSLAREWHSFTQLGASVFPYRAEKDRAAGIGLDYVHGQDPDAKLAAQDFWRLTFKGQF